MPSLYAHYRFGELILPRLPADIRGAITRNRTMFDAGLQGPDFFFFYKPASQNSLRTLARTLHHQTGAEFFTRVSRDLRIDSDEAILAYLYGLLGHYALDSLCHAYIATRCTDTVTHNAMESEFERFLMVRDGIRRPHAYPRHKLLRPDKAACFSICELYDGVSGTQVYDAVRSQRLFIALLTARDDIYRFLAGKVTRLLGESTMGLMVPSRPDPAFPDDSEALLECFNRALSLYPELMEELQDHLTFRAPCDAGFSAIFG